MVLVEHHGGEPEPGAGGHRPGARPNGHLTSIQVGEHVKHSSKWLVNLKDLMATSGISFCSFSKQRLYKGKYIFVYRKNEIERKGE